MLIAVLSFDLECFEDPISALRHRLTKLEHCSSPRAQLGFQALEHGNSMNFVKLP